MQLEQESKLVEGVKLIQSNAHCSIIVPFLKDLKSQVEVSDILKECFSNGLIQAFPDFFSQQNENSRHGGRVSSPQARDFNNTFAHAHDRTIFSEQPPTEVKQGTAQYHCLRPNLQGKPESRLDQRVSGRFGPDFEESHNTLSVIFRQIDQFLNLDLTTSNQTDLLYSQKQLLMKYIQFLQQGLIEKLLSSLV